MRRPIIIIVVVVVHNSMLIVDQTSSFLGSLGKLNYIKYYSLSISKVYSMWTLLTMSLLTLWKLMIHHYIQLLNDMLQNCWLSDDKITVILLSQNSSENNLFLLNRLPVPPNEEEKALFFSDLQQKFTCSYLYLEDLKCDSSKISTLSLSQSSQC